MSNSPTTYPYQSGPLQQGFQSYFDATMRRDVKDNPIADTPPAQYHAMEDSFYAGAQSFLLAFIETGLTDTAIVELSKELALFGLVIEQRYADAGLDTGGPVKGR